MSFESLGLTAALCRTVADKGYTTPTPIQAAAIPAVLAGRDLMAAAQTGTGKTAGFTLPMLQMLAANAPQGGRRAVRALVLTPTRELCLQVMDSIRTYGKQMPLKSTAIFGGVSINPQISSLRQGVDIIVATPGRLLDHLNQRTVDLSRVEILVLDEADRMLDMGFIRDIRKVLAVLPRKRQNLLFSATFSDEIRTLANGMLDNPASIEVAARNTAVETVQQLMHPVDKERKRELLSWLIGDGNWKQVLVFVRTKHGADRLAKQLAQDGLRADAIHGNKSQAARTRALSDFKNGKVRVLVATDVASRGLDIDMLPHVVNFELPTVAEDYVHRIGRTGRAGRDGIAVSLVCVDEQKLMKDIERLLKTRIPSEVVTGFEVDKSIRAEPLFKPRGPRPPRHQQGRPASRNRNEGRKRRA
ncbi:MAG: DEAD/DEAH box helicase [Xanthomonadaceae bacterium]|nr:DEAD/DEAH box helicase [Xanthomonadaceae bacterium]